MVLLILSSCEESKSGREIWISRDISSYSIDQLITCFCMYSNSSYVVRVENDTIHSVIDKQTNQPIPYKGEFYSVSDLFDLIDQARESNADILKVRYNMTYGFPEKIQIDYSRTAQDDEITVVVSNFHRD
jgi:hypothetical protein